MKGYKGESCIAIYGKDRNLRVHVCYICNVVSASLFLCKSAKIHMRQKYLDYSCSRNWNLIDLQEVSKLLRNLLASFLSAPGT